MSAPLTTLGTAIDLTDVAPDLALRWLREMTLIRQFETVAESLVPTGQIPGGMHSAIGQEAGAVGVISALAADDIVTGTHRSHHVVLAKGLPVDRVMAELWGRSTGVVGGLGGHMHLADIDAGYFGSNGIVGAGVGIALGAALAASYDRRTQVAVGFMGDGALNVGRVWESANLAAAWKLPLIIVCENNRYAVETPLEQAMAGDSPVQRAAGFGLAAVDVDGQNVAAVHRATAAAVDRARAGDGPTFIELVTYRFGGHDVGDKETYRTADEVSQWRDGADPIDLLTAALLDAGLADQDAVDEITETARQTVAAAVEFAEGSPMPDPESTPQPALHLAITSRGTV